jgi:hypothetical protein
VVYVLLADNRLAIINLQSGAREEILELAEPPATEKLFVGRRVALGNDGVTLFALTSGADGKTDAVAMVDAKSLSVVARWPLDSAGFFQGLDVGHSSGRVYVFGQRDSDKLTVLALDSSNGSTVRSFSHDFADGRSWRVLQASISDDEQRLYLSYHGEDTTGVDWFRIDDALTRCNVMHVRPNVGCIPGHGGFDCSVQRCLVATGSAEILDYPSVDAATSYDAKRGLDTLLGGNNHVMEFTVDHGNQRLFALGSCGYTGGLSIVDLATGEADLLSREVCGERVVLGPEGTLLIATLPRPVPSLNAAGSALLVVDSTSGEVVREVSLPANPVDLAVMVQ